MADQHQSHAHDETAPSDQLQGASQQAVQILNKIDPQAAFVRVEALRARQPGATRAQLIESVIRQKCVETATVGALTSGAALVPGLGTLASLTLGAAADIGLTMKLQADLIMEIAALHERDLTTAEQHNALFAVTGINVGTEKLLVYASSKTAQRVSGRTAGRVISKAIPVVGIAASAGTNMLTTYVVGRRSDAYFGLGPEAMSGWAESMRALTGIDERMLALWWREAGGQVWSSTQSSVRKAGTAMGQGLGMGLGAARARLHNRGRNVQKDTGLDGHPNPGTQTNRRHGYAGAGAQDL